MIEADLNVYDGIAVFRTDGPDLAFRGETATGTQVTLNVSPAKAKAVLTQLTNFFQGKKQ